MAATQPISLEDLKFDYSNPRIVEFGVSQSMPEDELVKLLCDVMAVDEIILSVVKSGYFPNDPLMAIRQGKIFVVIEGNRRLAALKVITNYNKFKDLYPANIPKPSKALIDSLKKIPVFVENSREASWQYIGFKHVNGAAKWSSFAKAQYIANIHREYKVSLEEVALHIGDSNKTVEKLYQALMVIEQAEKKKIFNRTNIYFQKLYFSHLYTGLQYDGIRKFVGLKEDIDTDKPVDEKHLPQLEEVLDWIYGNKKEDIKPVIVSQNPDLRNLDQVLQYKHSIQILRSTRDLNEALESSEPDDDKFFKSLTNSKQELYKSLKYVATGYEGDEERLRIAGTIAGMADELYNAMNSKHQKKAKGNGKKERLTEL